VTAYVISEVEYLDPERVAIYRKLASDSVAQYGGRYLVRGGPSELIEGGPSPKALVVVEFPSMARAKEWYASPAYAKALEVRKDALDRRLVFVEGVNQS
jgi:uncharacterized protein (DUF1330 family)